MKIYSPTYILISSSNIQFYESKFHFPHFKVLQSVFFSFQYNELNWKFWVYSDNDLKLSSRKNTQVNKQNIRDS